MDEFCRMAVRGNYKKFSEISGKFPGAYEEERDRLINEGVSYLREGKKEEAEYSLIKALGLAGQNSDARFMWKINCLLDELNGCGVTIRTPFEGLLPYSERKRGKA